MNCNQLLLHCNNLHCFSTLPCSHTHRRLFNLSQAHLGRGSHAAHDASHKVKRNTEQTDKTRDRKAVSDTDIWRVKLNLLLSGVVGVKLPQALAADLWVFDKVVKKRSVWTFSLQRGYRGQIDILTEARQESLGLLGDPSKPSIPLHMCLCVWLCIQCVWLHSWGELSFNYTEFGVI